MMTAWSIPVGSAIFFSLALLLINLGVLLLLRRFLTLRATPAYLTVPVFLALVLPAAVVLLVPIDIVSGSLIDGSTKGIWLPNQVIFVLWRIAYWLIFVLTWFVPPRVLPRSQVLIVGINGAG
jgi:LMBR1-like membrane protein